MFAPIAEKIANLAAKNPDEKNSKLPASITPYANVLALSIVHAIQEALDENSTKPLTAWKSKWCEKNANGEFVLKDFTAAEKLSAAIDVYEKYVNILSERSLFDYDDMILSVIQACESHPRTARKSPRTIPIHHGRRVSGHELGAITIIVQFDQRERRQSKYHGGRRR